MTTETVTAMNRAWVTISFTGSIFDARYRRDARSHAIKCGIGIGTEDDAIGSILHRHRVEGGGPLTITAGRYPRGMRKVGDIIWRDGVGPNPFPPMSEAEWGLRPLVFKGDADASLSLLRGGR